METFALVTEEATYPALNMLSQPQTNCSEFGTSTSVDFLRAFPIFPWFETIPIGLEIFLAKFYDIH